jgi:sulfoacetaldehyde acetyltransferase
MTKMTTEEAFVKVLQMHGIENAFGIIGSAFMPVSDLFPKRGLHFGMLHMSQMVV